MNLVLGLVLAGILAIQGGELYRRAVFWLWGTVTIDDLTFYLDPNDQEITDVFLDSGSYDEPLQTSEFRRLLKPGDYVIDIGAHVGWYTVIASKLVGESGRVIAFEPDPVNFQLLKRNVALNGCNNVVLEQKAVSNEPGKIELLLAEDNGVNHSIVDFGDDRRRVEVEAVRLDDYLTEVQHPIALIKIDTEGAEGIILEGMDNTIEGQQDVKIFMEYCPTYIHESGYDPLKLLKRLQQRGFRFRVINETHHQVESAAAPEEILFVRTYALGGRLNLLIQRESQIPMSQGQVDSQTASHRPGVP